MTIYTIRISSTKGQAKYIALLRFFGVAYVRCSMMIIACNQDGTMTLMLGGSMRALGEGVFGAIPTINHY